MDSDWISVKDRLPLEEYRGRGVIGDFLVSVEHETREPPEDAEVMILTFDARDMKWKSCETMEDYNWGWNVTHWQEKPEPAN